MKGYSAAAKDKESTSSFVVSLEVEKQFAHLTGQLSLKPVIALVATAILFLVVSLLTEFDTSRIVVILAALLSPPILFLYARLTLQRGRGVFRALVAFCGFITYGLGCYLVFYEGLWGLVRLFSVFALSSLFWSIGCCILGLAIVYGVYPLTELCEAVRKRLAQQGDAGAQSMLGEIYASGRGVPKDYAEAVKWYRKAAEQGDAKAQYFLGEMYGAGQGVPRDYVQAYMWADLAAAQGDTGAQTLRDMLLIELMTPGQIAEAQRLAREWKAKGKN